VTEERRRRVGPVELATLEAGEGGRPLLLVHGFTGAKEDFGDFIGTFAAEGWWVVAPDLRGHGASEQPADEASYSLEILATDMALLATGLGWNRYCLVGHSMGGMIAQELCLADPSRVERLVLMDTDHGPVQGMDPETLALGIGVLRSQGLPALLDLIDSLPSAPAAASDARVRAERAGYVAFAEAKVRRCSAAMYAAMGLAMVQRPDRLGDLAGLAMPVQVLVGAEDTNFLPAAHRMAEALRTADLVVIDDAAHSPQFEHPAAWWAAVAPFLAS
jgi:pimeloyl-ACP methyl ester carboxylesterase